MRNVIVTGAGGFVGKRLVSELLLKGYDVYALVNVDKEYPEWKNDKKIHLIPYSHNGIESIDVPQTEYEWLINLAWSGVAGDDRADFDTQFNNVKVCADYLRFFSDKGIKRFCTVSSISEYESDYVLLKDGEKVYPKNMYGAAKRAAHLMTKVLANEIGVEYINVYLANLYGENGYNNVILHDTIIKLLKGVETKFSSGEQKYDFMHVHDAVEGLILIADKGVNNHSYYLGSSEPRKLKDYLFVIGDLISDRNDIHLGHADVASISLPDECFSNEKVREMGFREKYSFEEGIVGVIDYYRKEIAHGNI